MDRKNLAIALLIVSVVLSTVTVITALTIDPSSPMIRERFYNINTIQDRDVPSDGGINLQILRRSP